MASNMPSSFSNNTKAWHEADIAELHWKQGWAIIVLLVAVAMLCFGVAFVARARNASGWARRFFISGAVLSWWFCALALTISNRTLLTTALGGTWKFPFSTSLLHVSMKCLVATVVVHCRNDRHSQKLQVTPLGTILRSGGLIGTATAMDIGLSAASLGLLHVAVYTMCKNTSVVWTLGLSLLLRLTKPNWAQAALTVCVLGGMALATHSGASGVTVNWLGLVLALGSTAMGSSRWVFSERLMRDKGSLLAQQEDGSKPDAWAYLYIISPAAVLSLLPLALVFEVLPLVRHLPQYSGAELLRLGGGLLFTSCLAIGLVLTQAIALRRTSAFSVAILAFVKDTFQVIAGSLALSEPLQASSATGISLVLASSAAYAIYKALGGGSEAAPPNKTPADNASHAGARAGAADEELATLIPAPGTDNGIVPQ